MITYRYARCVDWDHVPVYPGKAESKTYWSVARTKDDNLRATFQDGKLIAVEILP